MIVPGGGRARSAAPSRWRDREWEPRVVNADVELADAYPGDPAAAARLRVAWEPWTTVEGRFGCR